MSATMSDLKNVLLKQQFKTGVELAFTWSKGGRLVVSVDKHVVATFTNAALARSIFGMYLGDECVSPSSKEILKDKWNKDVLQLKE